MDVFTGMAFSNLVMLAIIVATAETLAAHHATDIQSAADAAAALKPLAGALFARRTNLAATRLRTHPRRDPPLMRAGGQIGVFAGASTAILEVENGTGARCVVVGSIAGASGGDIRAEARMTSFGYTQSSEEHAPGELVRNARRAEEVGFEFVSISDHFQPWVSAQGHSPFVLSVLGAVSQSTERIRVGVGVTCPIVRVHPAIVAHAAATTALLFDGRFFLGLGTGEALNEHMLVHRWPPADVRLSMLEEAIGVIRSMWTGETVDHRGAFYEVENVRTLHEVWPNGGLTGQLSPDLPTWSHFEETVAIVSEADATKSVPCGPDVEPLLDSIRQYMNAGYDHLYFHQIGPDQEGFFRFWSNQPRPALAEQIDMKNRPNRKVR